jgi:hypoxia up-regulated 1
MAPHGRRRLPPLHVLLPLLILSLLCPNASAAPAVLGIDLGTEYIKAALVKPGIPLEIVLTKDSKRKEAATLAFKPSRLQATDVEALPERLYGGDAIALAGRYPGDVYPNLKILLGVEVESTLAQEYGRRYPGLNVESLIRNETSKKGTVGFKSQVFEKTEPPFMVEELLAMELKNIKANAEAVAGQGMEITDVVLSIPPFYAAEEKRALELAADLAGLRVLGLISDGMAVGLNYATSRTFPSISEGAKPEFHLVYDMGAGSTTATVLRFQGRTVKDFGKRNKTIQEVQVMGTSWKKDLGGDAWNQLIVDDMIAKFVDIPKMKSLDVMPVRVRKNAKTVARLWKEAERMRQVLSANTQTSATLEGLFFEDVNFKYKLSRADFEDLAMEQASEVSVPLVSALDAAGISIQELNSVILHGGAVRTPFVQKHLEAVAGGSSKIRTNVNADEAAVLGAAFKAAGLSPSFRVKDIRVEDTSGFDVRLRWTIDGKERAQKVFTQKSLIGAEKQVPVKTLEDITFELSQIVSDREVPISEVKASNLTASVAQLKDKHGCAPTNISTTFTMRLSPLDGLPEVIAGSVSCEVESTREGGVMDNVKGLFGFGSKKGEDQEALKEDLSAEADTTPISPSTGEETPASSAVSTSTSSKPAKLSSSTIIIPLSITSKPLGLNLPVPSDQLTRIRTRLAKFDTSDLARVHRAEALNTLESFTYRARDYITDPNFIAHSSEKIRQTLEQKLSEASEWLYGDGVDAKLSDFQDRLNELKSLVEPVMNRKEEASKREGAIKILNDSLEQMKGMIKMVESSVEKAAEDAKHSAAAEAEKSAAVAVVPSESAELNTDPDPTDDLEDDPYSSSSSPSTTVPPEPSAISPYTPADLSTLQISYTSISAWLEEKLTAQSKLTPHDDPAFPASELELKSQELQKLVRDVVVKNIRLSGAAKGRGKGGRKAKGKSKKNKDKVPTEEDGADAIRSRVSSILAQTGTGTATASSEGSSSSSRARKDEL